MNSQVKSALKSKTIWASVGVVVAAGLPLLGIHLSQDDAQAGVDAIGHIVTSALALIAIYGRITATHRIG